MHVYTRKITPLECIHTEREPMHIQSTHEQKAGAICQPACAYVAHAWTLACPGQFKRHCVVIS